MSKFHTYFRLFTFLTLFGAIFSLGLPLVIATEARAESFLSVLPDLPLPQEIQEIEGSQMDFDSPTGRIIQVTAVGEMSPEAIDKFYASTLPELGWDMRSNGVFLREKEKLLIEITTENNQSLILFELSSQSNNN